MQLASFQKQMMLILRTRIRIDVSYYPVITVVVIILRYPTAESVLLYNAL